MLLSEEIAAAVDAVAGEAMFSSKPNVKTPLQKSRSRKAAQPEARSLASPKASSPRAPHSRSGAKPQAPTIKAPRQDLPAAPPSATGGADESHFRDDLRLYFALVGEITAIYRRYCDLRRAEQRLLLQAKATCRSVCGSDKVAGARLYEEPTAEVALWLAPYHEAVRPLREAINLHERLLTKLGRQLPVAEWASGVAGLSPRFLAMIVGECGIGPGEYRSVSALWKRMGMAVIGAQRQRRVTGDAALEHGYVPRRRSLMWNVGESIIKQQVRKDPADEEARVAIGDYGQLYLERKAYEAERVETKAHAHNRAKRHIEKRLLRELWRAWRQASLAPIPTTAAPASEDAGGLR